MAICWHSFLALRVRWINPAFIWPEYYPWWLIIWFYSKIEFLYFVTCYSCFSLFSVFISCWECTHTHWFFTILSCVMRSARIGTTRRKDKTSTLEGAEQSCLMDTGNKGLCTAGPNLNTVTTYVWHHPSWTTDSAKYRQYNSAMCKYRRAASPDQTTWL